MSRPVALEDLSWTDDAINMLAAYAKSGLVFTAEDLRQSMRPAPNANQYGAAFRAARQLGIITALGTRESTTPSRKGGLIRVWTAAPKEKS